MKKAVIFAIFALFVLSFVGSAYAQSCSGTPSCSGLTSPSTCNARCACQWSAGSCTSKGCTSCTTQSTCTASSCTWTPAPSCGDGSCNGAETCTSCPADCGTCPSTTTTTTTSDGGPTPIKIVFENPKDGSTLKRGFNPIIMSGYKGSFLGSGISINAESVLFGNISLKNDFENKGDGVYGANVTLGRNILKGQYSISAKGSGGGSFDEERILVNVNPDININATVKNKYFKGERIKFEGFLSYFDGSPVKNNSFRILVYSKDTIFNKTIKSNIDGWFSDSYLISFAEPDGKWTIDLGAEDKAGNEGKIIFETDVSIPSGVAFYVVNFLSPFENAEYKRGTSIPITVEVKDEGKPLANASVDFRTPNGESVNFNEVAAGTYIAEYKIRPDDPLGKWNIAVEAVKTVKNITKAGGTRIPVVIRSSDMNIVLASPKTTSFFTGLKIDISADLSYMDGTKIEKAIVSAVIGNESVRLIEKEIGVYSGSYIFTERDADVSNLRIEASDPFGNSAFIERIISVEKLGILELRVRLFYYNVVAKYWYAFVLGAVLLVLLTKPIWHKNHLKSSYKSVLESKKRTIEMEKETQRKYYKQHAISRENYDELMMKYRERVSALDEKELKIKKGLEKYSKK